MDIREVRRHNLKRLMDERFGAGARGAQSRLADMLGIHGEINWMQAAICALAGRILAGIGVLARILIPERIKKAMTRD